MASVFSNVFSEEELEYLTHHPEVLAAHAKLGAGSVYFSIPATDEIQATLKARWGLEVGSSIPMRWIQGDTAPHKDVGPSAFQTTFLVYLSDSPGELVVDSQTYPIQANVGFSFQEGLSHQTQNTENAPRLLVGPMNERLESVGGPPISYYPTEADALAFTNVLGTSGYTVTGGPFGYSSWRIASNSSGSSPQNIVYTDGAVLLFDGAYYLYPSAPCFLEGSKLLCQVDGLEQYVPIEKLQKGTLVKTSLDGFKPVALLGKGAILNPGDADRTENRLYKCSPLNYPDLDEDLYLTGCHSILEASLTEKQKDDTKRQLGKLFGTDRKYRLMAWLDDRAEPWNSSGTYPIWHLALEHADDGANYGVYANGLLVETCSLRFLKNKSNMDLK